MRKPRLKPAPSVRSVRTGIRNLRRFFSEYDRAGVTMSGPAVDGLCERLRSFEIDLDGLGEHAAGTEPIEKLPLPKGPPEIARRWGVPFEGGR